MKWFADVLALLALVSVSACGGDLPDYDEPRDEAGTGTETDSETGADAGHEAGSGEGGGDGGATCGNGTIEPGEACDGEQLAGQGCEDLGFGGGELTCASNCEFDATGCTQGVCGNGVIDPGEECDGIDVDGLDCTDLGLGAGEPTCTDSCKLDTTACGTLGEGDACTNFNPCPGDLTCVSGTCFDGSPGDPCKADNHCESGECVGGNLLQNGVCS